MLAMELLPESHPEDCSTCPKYGACELQTLIRYIGPKTGRMKLRSKGFASIDGVFLKVLEESPEKVLKGMALAARDLEAEEKILVIRFCMQECRR